MNVETFYQEIGANIRNERLRKGITQEILAERLDLTRASIVNLEKGRHKPAIHQLIIIADILAVDYSAFLPKSNIKKKNVSTGIDFENAVFQDQVVKKKSNQSILKNFLSAAH